MERLKPRTFSFWPVASAVAAAALYICLSGLNGLSNAHSTSVIYLVNALLLVAVSAWFGFITMRVQGTVLAGALIAAILLVSPFARSVLVNPVSGESLLGLLGLGVLLADVLGAVALPNVVAIVLPPALVAITPEYSFAIIGCTVGGFTRKRRNGIIAAILLAVCALVPKMLSVLRSTNGGATVANNTSFTITMVSIGVTCFILGPLLLLGMLAASHVGSMRTRPSFLAVTTALLAMIGGFILPSDPSPAIFAAEACGLVGIAIASMNQTVVVAALAVCGAASLFLLRPVANALPAVVDWREDAMLSAALVKLTPQHGCIASDNDVDVLSRVNGLAQTAAARWSIKRSAVDCLDSSVTPDAMIAVGEERIRTWGPGAIALGVAQLSGGNSSAEALAIANAKLNPKVGHPGGFPISLETPLGVTGGFTITAGYTYEFPCTAKARNSRWLTFAAYDPLHDYGHADPVRLTIAVDDRAVFSRIFHPNDPIASDWHVYRVPLPALRECHDIRFGATAPSGSAVASWVSVAAPTLHS